MRSSETSAVILPTKTVVAGEASPGLMTRGGTDWTVVVEEGEGIGMGAGPGEERGRGREERMGGREIWV